MSADMAADADGDSGGDALDRVMVDIETLGLDPGAVILSIGACRFSPTAGVADSGFYVEIDQDSCLAAGLDVDEDTLEWWRDQDAPAPLEGERPLGEALKAFTDYLSRPRGNVADEIWANSPSFDCRHLETAYDAVGQRAPWKFYQERDVRTVRALPGAVELDMAGREHHARDDAIHQAREVAATLAAVGQTGGDDVTQAEVGGDV